MKAEDIIKQISFERGIDSFGKDTLDLVPLNDLNVHKREVWNLSITSTPEEYFFSMDEKCKNKACYKYKFEISGIEEGKELCRELSLKFGLSPCEMSTAHESTSAGKLYLAVHIHPEFSFTPKSNKSIPVTQDLVLQFV